MEAEHVAMEHKSHLLGKCFKNGISNTVITEKWQGNWVFKGSNSHIETVQGSIGNTLSLFVLNNIQ